MGGIVGGGAVVGGLVVVGATVVGGSVVAVVVCTGGDVVPAVGGGEVVPVLRGVIVPTERCVVAVVSPGAAGMVVVDSTVEDVDVDEELDVVVAPSVVVGRAVVEDDWLATCCLDDVSSPVATSNNRAAMATVARAYSPTLNR